MNKLILNINALVYIFVTAQPNLNLIWIICGGSKSNLNKAQMAISTTSVGYNQYLVQPMEFLYVVYNFKYFRKWNILSGSIMHTFFPNKQND